MLAFDSYLVQLIEKLSVKTPSGEVKLKVLKEITKEYQVQWDTTETEEELLKPPEERIVCTPPLSPRAHTHLVMSSTNLTCILSCTAFLQEGPNNFVSASGMPLQPVQKQFHDASNR